MKRNEVPQFYPPQNAARNFRLRFFSTKIVKRVLPFIFLVVAIFLGIARYSYPTLVADIYSELRYAKFEEVRYKFEFINYFTEHISALKKNIGGVYEIEIPLDPEQSLLSSGIDHFHLGNFKRAAQIFQAEIDREGENEERLLWLAVANMRIRESAPANMRDARGSLSFDVDQPQIQESGVLSLPILRDSRSLASEALEKLQHYPEGLYQWLSVLDQLTRGATWNDIPQQYKVNTPYLEVFYGKYFQQMNEKYSQLNFTDRAKELGIAENDSGKGIAIEDFDRDGFLDVVSGGSFSALKYFRNHQGKRFIESTTLVELDDVEQAYSMSVADYDNDNWPDLFVARPFHRYHLFRNRTDGTFEDVTESVGLAKLPADQALYGTWHSAWSDVDNDGDLDLFLSQWGQRAPGAKGIFAKPPMSSTLFLNHRQRDGAISFRNATAEFGLQEFVEGENFVSASFGDIDGDSFQDLFLSGFSRRKNILFRNIAGERFEPTNLITRTIPGFMSSFIDINHDGKLDLFHASNGQAKTIFNRIKDRKQEEGDFTHTLFVQQEDGSFRQQNHFFDRQVPVTVLGATFGDMNNDGCHDFYFGTGNPEPWFLFPNFAYIGRSSRATAKRNLTISPGFSNLVRFPKGKLPFFLISTMMAIKISTLSLEGCGPEMPQSIGFT